MSLTFLIRHIVQTASSNDNIFARNETIRNNASGSKVECSLDATAGVISPHTLRTTT